MSSFLGREEMMPTSVKAMKKKHRKGSSAPSSSETDGMKSPSHAPPKKKIKKKPSDSGDEGTTKPQLIPAKQKKAARTASSLSSADEGTSTGSVSSPPMKKFKLEASNSKVSEVKTPPSLPSSSNDSWSKEQIDSLIKNIEEALPKTDTIKHTTQEDKLNWSEIALDDFSAQDCKRKWQEIGAKVRKYRTLTEIVEDAKKLNIPKLLAASDMPKKPLSAYLRFYIKNQKDMRELHPDLTIAEVTKIIGKKYVELSAKKKKKLESAYQADMEVYKKQLEEFMERHPECKPTPKHRVRTPAPPRPVKIKPPDRPLPAMQIYVKHKTAEHLVQKPADSKLEVMKVYQKKYSEMKDGKKIKYINKALSEFYGYLAKAKAFREEHPDIEFTTVDHILTKPECKVKDKMSGRPEKPAVNLFSHFTRVRSRNNTDTEGMSATERIPIISKQWKQLTEEERQEYADQLASARKNYSDHYKRWKSGLDEHDLKRIEAEEAVEAEKQANKISTTAPTIKPMLASKTPKKPVSAIFMYISEKSDACRRKNPDKSQTEITRMLSREFQELPEAKKKKYAEKAKTGGSSENNGNSKAAPTNNPSNESSSSEDSNSGSESDSDSDDSSSSSGSESPQVPKQPSPLKPANSVSKVYTSSSDDSSSEDSDSG